MQALAVRVMEWGTASVGVAGDLILDRYTMGTVHRVSPEAPVPVLRVGATQMRLGGAGNVAANLASVGMKPIIVGVVGKDSEGRQLCQLLRERSIDDRYVVEDPARSTVVKERLIARNQQMLRVDWEKDGVVTGEAEARLVQAIEQADASARVWIVSDYGKGVVTQSLLAALRRRGGVVLVDPKGRDYSRYAGCSVVTPNRAEAEGASGVALDRPEAWREAAQRLIDLLRLQAAVITLGPEGIYALRADGTDLHVPTQARMVYDVTGAGDTVIALLAAALAAGDDLFAGIRVANAGAGIVVGRLGTATVTRAELVAVLERRHMWDGGKIIARAQLPQVLDERRARGEVIVLTNGCFDILHEGHIDYLHFARSRGDLLVVGLNDDESVSRLKGEGRPVNPLAARAKVLAALSDVDYVVPFGEDTPETLVREVSPHILVKGEDWRDKGVVGREWVESHGGEVLLAPVTPARSTTRLLEKIREQSSRKP
ncbi:MAG: D-glycero-beta-D-manno-heptose 1-phosphate adenylyltransferase [Planctomycetota bacterium]